MNSPDSEFDSDDDHLDVMVDLETGSIVLLGPVEEWNGGRRTELERFEPAAPWAPKE